ncbi:MAG: glycosyltransferase family 9 protein [Anaerohalosphaeraceae bacterium]|nr:glycosyltransferase family 9 protein [Anaerohalosphaeraceae bacterium]
MEKEKDILDLWAQAQARQDRLSTKALIIQPGAIGDCILTLPLAAMMKDKLNVGIVKILGRSSYIDYFLGRSCIDGIGDMDSIDLHRFFVSPDDFHPDESDPLIEAMANYKIIINFLGEPGSDFEQNLAFAANCSNPVEVATFQLKPPAGNDKHITSIYANHLAEIFHLAPSEICQDSCYLEPMNSDRENSQKLIKSLGLSNSNPIAVIHPGSGGQSKCWHIDNFYSVAEILAERKINPVFLIGPAEIERFKPSTIDRFAAVAPVVSDFSLTETFQLLCLAGCFIGNDSGISHMAAALGVPTISCFGPTDPAIYSPIGPKVKTFKFDSNDFTSPAPEAAAAIAKQAYEFITS